MIYSVLKCLILIQKYALVNNNLTKSEEHACNASLPCDRKNEHGAQVDRIPITLGLRPVIFTSTCEQHSYNVDNVHHLSLACSSQQ